MSLHASSSRARLGSAVKMRALFFSATSLFHPTTSLFFFSSPPRLSDPSDFRRVRFLDCTPSGEPRHRRLLSDESDARLVVAS